MNVKIKKLYDNAVIPTEGSEKAAGHDLYACLDSDEVVIYPHTTLLVKTGIAMEIPDGYYGGVYARSGLSSKKGLRPGNCVGVIDSDYRGEIKVPLEHYSHRWKIEVMFKQQKQYLGLKSFMIRSAKAIDRFLIILTLAWFWFTWQTGFVLPFSVGIRRYRGALSIL